MARLKRKNQLDLAEYSDAMRPLGDLRFRSLLGYEGWRRLPSAVRARFSKRMGSGKSVCYTGRIVACRMRPAGWLLAQLCRLIGAPLPLGRDTGVAAVVTVTEDGDSGGQVWTRMYARTHGFPQVIHSAKRFAGPTGLEEYLGGGFGVALRVSAHDDGICFISDHYFLMLGTWRLRIAQWLAPGVLTIEHVDLGQGSFGFILDLRHPLLGELIHQIGDFHDAVPEGENP
jgi:hypothetical protein